jgi:eukaryotic-like serine/threonine-protein kinase
MAIRVRSAVGREWLLAESVGSGSEGVVYAVRDKPELVAKLAPCPRDPEGYRRRLERLVRQAREPRTMRLLSGRHRRLAWPLDVVATPRGGALGYLMADLRATHQPLDHLLSPAAQREHLPGATWATALHAAVALAELLTELHAEGYVVGDLKPDNLWVDAAGRVAMADTDSLQFTDGGETFACRMRTAGYTAPECVDSGVLPDPSSDSFVLAVLVHQLLMGGLHPFHGHPADGSAYASLDDNLLHGRSRLTDRTSVVLPAAAPPLDLLPVPLLALFRRAFGAIGRRDPEARPRPAEWARELRHELLPGRLVVCERTPEHRYSVERPWCPWCDQRRRLVDGATGGGVGERRR